MVSTNPIIKAVIPTKGKDLYPIIKHCLKNSCHSYLGFHHVLIKRPVKTAISPISCKNIFEIEDEEMFAICTSKGVNKKQLQGEKNHAME